MNFRGSSLSGKTGLTRTSSHTSKNATAKRSCRSAAALYAISPNTAAVHAVVPLPATSIKTTAPKNSSYARSVMRSFHGRITASPNCTLCAVRTAAIPLWPKKTASTLYSINVSTPNALTTSTSLKRWSAKIWVRTTAKTNISSTTSTASLR